MWAQQEAPALWNLQPPTDPEGFLLTGAGERLEHKQLDLGLSISRSLFLAPVDLADSHLTATELQRSRFAFSLAYAPLRELQFSLQLPFYADSSPSLVIPLEGNLEEQLVTGLGDLQLGLFVPLVRHGLRYPARGGPTAAGLYSHLKLPTGAANYMPGTGLMSVELGGAIEGGSRLHRMFNVSVAVWAPTQERTQPAVRLQTRLGGAYTLVPHSLEGMAELGFGVEALPVPALSSQTRLDALLGMRWRSMQGFSISLGGGIAWAPEQPLSVQALVGVHQQLPPNSVDRDFDDVVDYKDVCLNEPEDRDRFDDSDGCPELDNDQDGLLDTLDRCPLVAEDLDGFKDADGCPELDNDEDGISDVLDNCPIDAEDLDQFEDQDGCPELDNDKDGLLDTHDRCPLLAEDRDGFEDQDGCPDPDNDQDGVLDTVDQCLSRPEDIDQFQDEDGCPDPDNDNDGLLDADDLCPIEPEDPSSNTDPDGCPASRKVIKRGDYLLVLSPLYFDPLNMGLLQRSRGVVDVVADVLKQEPADSRFLVEIFAEQRGDITLLLPQSMSRARVLMQALEERGIERTRLSAAGYDGPPSYQSAGSRVLWPLVLIKVLPPDDRLRANPAGVLPAPASAPAPAPAPASAPASAPAPASASAPVIRP
ncbi:MAG: thrombospondin type 3 repeat-containing protein [Myxococcota bacterium]